MDREKILESLKQYKPFLQSKYGVLKLGIFGSVARRNIKTTSDIDVVMELKNPDPFILLDIEDGLSNLLDSEVDLIRLRKNMNKLLKQRIEREAIYV